MAVYVQVKVASEAYALPVGNALEIAQAGQVTAVPGARPELRGIRSLRGRVLPVVHLARLLGLEATAGRLLLVAEVDGLQAGFLIDEVSDVGDLPEPTEETASRLLRGAVLRGGELIGVLDVPAVFEALAGGQS